MLAFARRWAAQDAILVGCRAPSALRWQGIATRDVQQTCTTTSRNSPWKGMVALEIRRAGAVRMLVRFRSYLDSLLEPVAFVYADAFGRSVANFRQGTMYRSGPAVLRSRIAVLHVGCREGLGMVRVDAAIG